MATPRSKVAKGMTILASAAAMVGLSTPAHADTHWTGVKQYLKNSSTGRCLTPISSGGSNLVHTGACSGWKWMQGTDRAGIRYTADSGASCLDNNGKDVYVLSCTFNFEGMNWWPVAEGPGMVIFNSDRTKVLTGWNDGKVTVEPPVYDTSSPTYWKQHWNWA